MSLVVLLKNKVKKDGLNHSCRECHAVYQKKHYEENKKYYTSKARKSDARFRAVISKAKDKPCMDCGGIFNPWQMDFDHVRGKKLFSISEAIRIGWSLVRLAEEIAKCDLVCANCHRERTHNRIHAPDEGSSAGLRNRQMQFNSARGYHKAQQAGLAVDLQNQ